jgi:hypothetical protein
MRNVRRTARAKLRATALVVAVAAVVVSWITLSGSSASPTRGATVRTRPATAISTAAPYHPRRITPPQTAVERTVNQALEQSSNQQGLAALEASSFPVPATSAVFPPIEAADSASPAMYAMAFTQELLDIDFATATRNELLAWAGYNNAPNTTIDLPASAQRKVLPDSLTTSPAALPSTAQWSAFAKSRTAWRVSGLVVSVNPLMVIYDVSGILTVRIPGHAPSVESISFGLTLGGASLHPGYGAVALDDWTVN